MSTNHERYLAGEPLNDELAALKRGELPDVGPSLVESGSAPHQSTENAERDLTRSEREALKELRQSPGWPVLQRLLDRAMMVHKISAALLSEDDPLANSSELAQAWAYVNIFKRACAEFNLLVETEIKAMEGSHGKGNETQSAVEGA